MNVYERLFGMKAWCDPLRDGGRILQFGNHNYLHQMIVATEVMRAYGLNRVERLCDHRVALLG